MIVPFEVYHAVDNNIWQIFVSRHVKSFCMTLDLRHAEDDLAGSFGKREGEYVSWFVNTAVLAV